MNYLSVCSGIEAASVAWQSLGWEPLAFAEIESFPCSVLQHHYPHVPNLGDMTRYAEWPALRPDLLVGGTPCQSFSVAGLRQGLADPRGNLALVFLGLVDRFRPRWVVWENVPGVLSSNGGRDFGAFLGGLAELGYGWAYRVLDAQHFGVPQRRRRVFVVGYLGDWRPPVAVLFERHSLSGDSPPRREARQDVAPTISARTQGGGGLGTDFDCDGGLVMTTYAPPVSPAMKRRDYKGPSSDGDGDGLPLIVHTLSACYRSSEDGCGRGTPLVPMAFGWQNSSQQGDSVSEYITPSLDKSKTPAIAFAIQERAVSTGTSGPDGIGVREEVAYTIEARTQVQAVAMRGRDGGATAELSDVPSALRASSGGGDKAHVLSAMSVRRLTPTECERLQGFSDGWTLVPHRGKPAADGPRYKALGNSMAVPVVRWIGERIAAVDVVCIADVSFPSTVSVSHGTAHCANRGADRRRVAGLLR